MSCKQLRSPLAYHILDLGSKALALVSTYHKGRGRLGGVVTKESIRNPLLVQ